MANESALVVSKNGKKSSDSGEEKATLSADVTLPADVLESLYQSYAIKQKRDGLSSFLVASIMFDLWAIIVPQGQRLESLGITCSFLVLNIGLTVFLKLCGKSRFKGAIWEVAPHIAWLLAILQLFLQLFFKGTVTPRDSLGWAVLINFLVYVTLPVPLKFTGLLLGIGSFAIYDHTIFGLAKKENFFWAQQGANMVLMISAAGVGLLWYFLGESKQRRAFLEAKKSLEVKMLIEEQSAEQERLLLSVLPEHVAVKMRQDLGSTDSEQFKKIYMSRHENVSILYADIVGFTAISSKYSAPDLVKMLNELFARFDRLAEKYHQLRIKILGDCYYCIAGAPVETKDHAALCVYMGLSMVKAIKYVQQKTNSPVDMRVGIHTGAVLAGILGQRQWQFDVYSRDVELANKMESSGMAGRVHISEKTYGFLSGEFEVEPGYGERREESLRIAGLKTYFITKVLKPFESNEQKNGTSSSRALADNKAESIEPDGPSEIFRDDDDSKCTSPNDQTTDEEAIVQGETEEKQKESDFKQRMRRELVSRDGHGELSKDTNAWLTFRNKDHEAAYAAYREPLSSVPLIAALFVHFVGGIYSMLVLPQTMCHFVIVLSPLIIIVPIVFLSVAESFPNNLPSPIVSFSQKFNDLKWLRRSAAIAIILLIGVANSLDMYVASGTAAADNQTEPFPEIPQPTDLCLFPSYFSSFAVLILIATSVITQLSHVAKILLMVFVTAMHCGMNIFFLEEHFKNEDYHTWNSRVPLRFTMSALLVAVTIALSHLSRHIDKRDRLIFMWKIQASEQKEKASDMRRRNEALVYNVLPVHVAEHFMGNKKRSYDELYSQSYAEVGVLFASMPNFSDFYSEETVNNQGLECLRFLNEVISDFDALLELPQFKDVIKIKTIGSTYMAASGLNPTKEIKPEDGIVVRWEHLARLVEFALELKKALQGINEQSFNHFVLKMGINHGPITAGVIGARKPHYDIWGNTVNVASRMESTGKAGAIQVTEETCQILQQFDYTFEQRGLVAVKGKGQLLTFYLQGKGNKKPTDSLSGSPAPASLKERPTVENDTLKGVTNSIVTDSPKTGPRSVSSCSNSPNSVRVNQDYVDKLNALPTSNDETKEATNSEDDIDMLDAKTPLLKDKNSTMIVESSNTASRTD